MAQGNEAAFVEFERVQKSYDGENLVVKDLNLSLPKEGAFNEAQITGNIIGKKTRFDEITLQKTGITTETIDLSEVFYRIKNSRKAIVYANTG